MSNYIAEENVLPSADPDAAQVAEVRKGDLSAFETLVARHQKRMLNIAFRITGDYDDACEVTQDAFVSAYRNLGSFRGGAKFSTWLTTIVINLSRNRLKQVKGRRGHEAYSLDAPLQTPEGEMTIDPPSREPSTLDRLEQKDRQKGVQDCIAKLDPEFREVLVLRDLQEFSYDEIGNMLKVREGTVKSRLFRARESVKECLKKVWGEL
jgi:RNA polymerase sigma-70 factor (ECF subfamily)